MQGYNNSIIISKPPHLHWSQMAPALSNLWGATGMITYTEYISQKAVYFYLLVTLIRIKRFTSLSLSLIIDHIPSTPSIISQRCSTQGALTTCNDRVMFPPVSLDVTPPPCPHLLHTGSQSQMSLSQHHRIIITLTGHKNSQSSGQAGTLITKAFLIV